MINVDFLYSQKSSPELLKISIELFLSKRIEWDKDSLRGLFMLKYKGEKKVLSLRPIKLKMRKFNENQFWSKCWVKN